MKNNGESKRPGFWDAWNETPAQAAEQAEQERSAKPERLCAACRIPMEFVEKSHLVTYENAGLGVRFSGFPNYREAELFVCPRCGRYGFFRPADGAGAQQPGDPE